MPPQLVLPQPLRNQIVREARDGAPEEICGIVRGRAGVARELVPAVNVAEERTINYLVDPKVLMMQFAFENDGDEMTAIYHSHPESEAYPSATDAWSAHYPDAFYIICSLAGTEPAIRAFLLQDLDLDCDLAQLRREVAFHETRPNLFAYYQAPDRPLPPALQALARASGSAVYVVYGLSPFGDEPEVRCVRVVEAEILLDA